MPKTDQKEAGGSQKDRPRPVTRPGKLSCSIAPIAPKSEYGLTPTGEGTISNKATDGTPGSPRPDRPRPVIPIPGRPYDRQPSDAKNSTIGEKASATNRSQAAEAQKKEVERQRLLQERQQLLEKHKQQTKNTNAGDRTR